MTLTIHDQLIQGSEEWHDVRRGLVTASTVGKLLTVGSPGALDYDCPECDAPADSPCLSRSRKTPTPIKTPHSIRTTVAADRAKDSPPVIELADNETSAGLTMTLIAERIAGWTEDTPTTSDMFRGVISEPYARDLYSEHYAPVTEVGFILREEDGWTLGLSPDGLVGDDGLVEFKAPRARTHLKTILADKVPTHYMAQCQAALLASGRKWVDFGSFVGGLPFFVKRVYPDPVWFAAIEAACRAFEARASEVVADYRSKVAGLAVADRIPTDLELVV